MPVNRFEIGLTARQGQLMEHALRAHLKELNELKETAYANGDNELAMECDSSANVVRNTLAQVKDGLYNLVAAK